MAKLDASKQAILDKWASDCAKGVDVSSAEIAADGTVVKESSTVIMMQTLQGELTESVLDAAMKKAMATK